MHIQQQNDDVTLWQAYPVNRSSLHRSYIIIIIIIGRIHIVRLPVRSTSVGTDRRHLAATVPEHVPTHVDGCCALKKIPVSLTRRESAI